MFSQQFSLASTRINPAMAPRPHLTGAQAEAAEKYARIALTRELNVPPLSERMGNPRGYALVQAQRRSDLEALLLARPSERLTERAIDLICAICEESMWAAPESATSIFEDEAHPAIDQQAAQSASLLGWTLHLMGDALDARSLHIRKRIISEVRRRLITPLLAHDDYAFLRGDCAAPAAVLSAATIAILLIEPDGSRQGAAAKKLLRAMDVAAQAREQKTFPLADTLREAAARADLSEMMRHMSSGAVNLCREEPSGALLDEILFSHITGGYFVDPAGSGMAPQLSGAEVFRLGNLCGDSALAALGAHLCCQREALSPSVTGRMLDISLSAERAAELRAPKLKYASLDRGKLMVARAAGMYCSIHAGGGRGNAGDIAVFLDDIPILVDSGYIDTRASRRNLPTSSAGEHWTRLAGELEASFDPLPDEVIMGMDLTSAHPANCVHAHQRTMILSRTDGHVHLIDALDYLSPSPTLFHFITPQKPALSASGAVIGPVMLTWDGGPDVKLNQLPPAEGFGDGLYRIALDYAQPAMRMICNFYLERV